MKTLTTFLLILFGAIVGAMASYYMSRTVYSRSQASSILTNSGVVVSDEGSITYFANTTFLTREQTEALAMLSEYYEQTFVILSDEEPINDLSIEAENVEVTDKSSLAPAQE